ncbi:MAG: hypothetical protein RIS26_172 [Actinomycetota bacterium]|jgi:4-hydroxybenzoate polyprenyltransferase
MISIWARQLRIHQWVKNLLVMIPALASFQLLNPALWEPLILAFLSLSAVASAVYIFNDVVDAPNDRQHATKKNRPVASGKLSVRLALVAGVLLLGLGIGVAALAGLPFLTSVLIYLGATFAYTFFLKQVVLVDCLTLAGLYTIRVVAGGVVTGIALSFWLLAFSIFFFASLAWVKRYAELETLKNAGKSAAKGRGYAVTDQPLILALGVMSAFIAVLIFALYIDSDAIKIQYAVPQIAWLAIPMLMYLIGRIWFKANRGQMNEDPILFVLRDLPSLVSIATVGIALLVAHLGWS